MDSLILHLYTHIHKLKLLYSFKYIETYTKQVDGQCSTCLCWIRCFFLSLFKYTGRGEWTCICKGIALNDETYNERRIKRIIIILKEMTSPFVCSDLCRVSISFYFMLDLVKSSSSFYFHSIWWMTNITLWDRILREKRKIKQMKHNTN